MELWKKQKLSIRKRQNGLHTGSGFTLELEFGLFIQIFYCELWLGLIIMVRRPLSWPSTGTDGVTVWAYKWPITGGKCVCVCVLPKISGTLGRKTYWPMSKIRPAGGKKEQRDEEETSVEWAVGTGNRR